MGNIQNINSYTAVQMRFAGKRVCAKFSKSVSLSPLKKNGIKRFFAMDRIKVWRS